MTLNHQDISNRLSGGIEHIKGAFPGQAATGLEGFMGGLAGMAENSFSKPSVQMQNIASLATQGPGGMG